MPLCGFDNAAGIKFCGECGTRWDVPSSPVHRERKVVSVLFCDLVGFTSASDGADPEEIQARLSGYLARARAEIERFGATVEKFIGDAVMAAFGAPTVHEDDPERAVRAGLALLRAVGELNAGQHLDLLSSLGRGGAEAIDVVERAVRVLEAIPAGPELLEAYVTSASRFFMLGRDQRAIERADQALDLAQQLDKPPPYTTARRDSHELSMARSTGTSSNGSSTALPMGCGYSTTMCSPLGEFRLNPTGTATAP